MTLDPDSERAEALIRQARLAKQRNDAKLAEMLLKEAAGLSPESSLVLEALGDDLIDRRQTQAAMDSYKRAAEADPKNISAERKYAELVLRSQGCVDPMRARSEGESDGHVNGKIAVLLSLFVPGLGQMVTDQVIKGIGMLVAWALCWLFALMIPDGMKSLLSLFGLKGRGAIVEFNGVVLFPLAVAAAVHLWSIFDSAGKAGTIKTRKIVRPLPPVDKPFEL